MDVYKVLRLLWEQHHFSTSKMAFPNHAFAVRKYRQLRRSHHEDQSVEYTGEKFDLDFG